MILPAKPPPRKAKSVLQKEHPDAQESSAGARSTAGSGKPKRTVESGVFHELNQIDGLTSTWASGQPKTTVNSKALKNVSDQVMNLVEHRTQ